MTYSTEVAGLPEGGPATTAGVKLHLGITDDRDDTRLTGIVAAVNAKVRRWPCVLVVAGTAEAPAADWAGGEDLVEGATLLAARLFRRKNSPAGVEAFGAEGVAYVMRNDPDVAMLLGLGSWSSPAVG